MEEDEENYEKNEKLEGSGSGSRKKTSSRK